jgi:hypothetical protein
MKTKKKSLAAIILLLATFGYVLKDYDIVWAQSLPATKTFAWDARPVNESVSSYTVRLDGVTIGNPTGTTQQFTITTTGTHVLTVTATNTWGTSSPSTLNFLVIVPSSPANPRIE